MAVAPNRPAMFYKADAVGDEDQNISSVNVGQFGWTTNDITSVRDIITYVQAALDAATAAKNSADAAEAARQRVEEIEIQYRNIVADIDSKYKNMVDLVNQINTSSDAIQKWVAEAKTYRDGAEGYFNEIQGTAEIIEKYALQAIYRYNETGEVISGGITISPVVGTIQSFTLMQPNTNVVFEAFVDPESTGRQITLAFLQGTGANKLVWPKNIKWNNGREPTLSYVKGKMDIITLLTYDSGGSWLGFYNGGWFDAQ